MQQGGFGQLLTDWHHLIQTEAMVCLSGVNEGEELDRASAGKRKGMPETLITTTSVSWNGAWKP
jgi:hypothetical protein